MKSNIYIGRAICPIDGFKNSHKIFFYIPGQQNPPTVPVAKLQEKIKTIEEMYPVAISICPPTQEIRYDDEILVFHVDQGETAVDNAVFFYSKLYRDADTEMFFGGERNFVNSKGDAKKNVLSLSYGSEGDNTKKEVYLRSDNKITIESGSATITLDGEDGSIRISAPMPSSSSTGITIDGNVQLNGTLFVTGDVSWNNGIQGTLASHYHLGNLTIPTTPPFKI